MDRVKEAVGDKSYPSHWVLMTRDIIPGSRGRNYSKFCDMIAHHRKKTGLPYELPHLLEATAIILIHYVKTGERLYNDDPWTWTYSQDVSKDNYPLGVGGFAIGLRVATVSGCSFGILGVLVAEVLGFCGLDYWCLSWRWFIVNLVLASIWQSLILNKDDGLF